MNTKQEAAMRQALENSQPSFMAPGWRLVLNEDITALREALAEQPAAEPVAWISEVRCVGPEYGKKRYGALPIQSLQPGYYAHTPLYASPQPSKPLTDDELRNVLRNTNHMIRNAMYGPFWPELEQACRAIEAAHGITSKEGGAA